MHPLIRNVIVGQNEKSAVDTANPGDHPPATITRQPARRTGAGIGEPVWYQAKALEVAAEFFFVTPGEPELFCQRHQRLAAEQVEKVIVLLREKLAEPPTLDEIGRTVGCSPFHLSRTFSTTTGMTIPQYTRQLRMERAAELLKSGKFNVTQAALEVGYSSMSHFSQAFHETFGCCPGSYPLRTPAQSESQPAIKC